MSYLTQFGKDYDAVRAGYPIHWQIPDILDARFESIKSRAKNVTSQFGEDGLLEAIFEIIGTSYRPSCFEVGASDGRFFSNTWALRGKEWNAVLIEADTEDCAKIKDNANGVGKGEIIIGNWSITSEVGLDDFLEDTFPKFDLGVIDTDGDDIGHWSRMVKIRPRVIVIECMERENTYSRQATPTALIALGKEKQYAAVARTYCNMIFIADEELK